MIPATPPVSSRTLQNRIVRIVFRRFLESFRRGVGSKINDLDSSDSFCAPIRVKKAREGDENKKAYSMRDNYPNYLNN